jgi:hypothetical protein
LAVASVAAAAGLAALLAGAAFGLQALTLPRPSTGQLIASKTMRWVNEHGAVRSIALIDRRRVSGFCVNGQLRPRGEDPESLDASLLVAGREGVVEAYQHDGPLPSTRTVLAGCPRALGRRIGRYLNDRARVSVTHGFLRREPVLRLSFGQGGNRLLLIVDSKTYAPVAVRIPRGGAGWSHLAAAEKRNLPRPVLRLARRAHAIVEETA